MPFIEFDIRKTPQLIEAQLSLSFSQLSDVLRVVVEHSNGHEEQITLLKQALDELKEQNKRMESDLAIIRENQRSQSDDNVLRELQTLRQIVTNNEKINDEKTRDLRHELEGIQKRLAMENQSTSIAFSTTHEKISQLEKNLKEIDVMASRAYNFTALWNSDSQFVSTLVTSGGEQEQKEYLQSLPALNGYMFKDDGGTKNAGSGVPPRSEYADAMTSLMRELNSIRQQLEFMERRLRVSDDLDAKLREIEEKLRVLDATKADHLSLNSKTEKDTTTALSQRVQHLQEDLSSLMEKLNALAYNVDAASNNQTPKKRGSLPQIAPPPSTAVVASAQPVQSTASADETLRRRVAALESESLSLDQRKADKSELRKLYDTIDAISRQSPHHLQTLPESSGGGAADSPSAVLHKAKPPSARHRVGSGGPAAGKVSPLDNVTVVDSVMPPVDFTTIGTGAGRGGSASPRGTPTRPVFLGRTVVSVRDSSGGMTPASLACVNR